MKTERFAFLTEKKAIAFAEKFEKKNRYLYPMTTIQKAEGPVWWVFTSILPNARK